MNRAEARNRWVASFAVILGLVQVWAAIVLGFGGLPEWLVEWIFVSGWALSGGNLIWILVWTGLFRPR
jgi:hypothetical protein